MMSLVNHDETQFYLVQGEEVTCLNELFDIRIMVCGRPETMIENEYIEMMSSHGVRLGESRLGLKQYFLQFRLVQPNQYDLFLAYTELKQLFIKLEPYYIISSREPGKRYKVREAVFSPTQRSTTRMIFSVFFDVFEGVSESIETTLNAVEFSGNWQYSQGIVAEDYQYTHKSRNFEIWNLGDLVVDPRDHHELIIKIEGLSEGNVELFNQTTGERFIYHPPLNSNRGEVLTIDGAHPKLNGRHIGIDTNGGLISLAKGRNVFSVNGLSQLTISFEFRFRYI